MCAFSGHDRGGTRLSPRMTVCCACLAHTGVGTLGRGGPRQMIHLFFKLLLLENPIVVLLTLFNTSTLFSLNVEVL